MAEVGRVMGDQFLSEVRRNPYRKIDDVFLTMLTMAKWPMRVRDDDLSLPGMAAASSFTCFPLGGGAVLVLK